MQWLTLESHVVVPSFLIDLNEILYKKSSCWTLDFNKLFVWLLVVRGWCPHVVDATYFVEVTMCGCVRVAVSCVPNTPNEQSSS